MKESLLQCYCDKGKTSDLYMMFMKGSIAGPTYTLSGRRFSRPYLSIPLTSLTLMWAEGDRDILDGLSVTG